MLSLTRMRYLVRKGLGGLTETDLNNTDVDELLNLSLWRLSEEFPFKEKECRIGICCTPGAYQYGLPMGAGTATILTDAIISVTIHEGTGSDPATVSHGQSTKLSRMNWDLFDETFNKGDIDESQRGKPEWYYRERHALHLFPVPDDEYYIEVLLWKSIESMVEGVVDTADLPRNWHEIVVDGAIERGHKYNEDYDLARQIANFRVEAERSAALVLAKEERDSRYAGLEVLWDAPPTN